MSLELDVQYSTVQYSHFRLIDMSKHLQVLKTNAAIWFNKMCMAKQLKPKYINVKISGQKPRDKKITINAPRLRINQEIKFLYRKKQHLNQAHLATAPQYIPTNHDMLPQHLVCKYELNFEYCNLTLARNKDP